MLEHNDNNNHNMKNLVLYSVLRIALSITIYICRGTPAGPLVSAYSRSSVLPVVEDVEDGDRRRSGQRPINGKTKVVLRTHISVSPWLIDERLAPVDSGVLNLKLSAQR